MGSKSGEGRAGRPRAQRDLRGRLRRASQPGRCRTQPYQRRVAAPSASLSTFTQSLDAASFGASSIGIASGKPPQRGERPTQVRGRPDATDAHAPMRIPETQDPSRCSRVAQQRSDLGAGTGTSLETRAPHLAARGRRHPVLSHLLRSGCCQRWQLRGRRSTRSVRVGCRLGVRENKREG